MNNLRFAILGFCVLLGGCSEKLSLESNRWSQQGPAPSKPKDLDPQASPLPVGSKNMIFQSQKIDGVEIEGTYYKEIANSDPEFISVNWATHIPPGLRAQIKYLQARSASMLQQFLARHPEIKPGDLVEPPQLIYQKDELRWKLVLRRPDGHLLGLFLNQNLQIERSQFLGSDLETALAALFPDGPMVSQVQKVWLMNLNDKRALSSPNVRVTTQSNQEAIAENAQFIYPIEDRRFEQVQVFFYLSKVLTWCQSNLKFTLPFVLEAETSVGFPQKTNTAFYYQHRVRLGDGDDEIFSRMPLDPSIVFHESFHSVIDAVAKLPTEGEGGSLNEAFADFFTAVVNENPNLGSVSYKKGPFKRTVMNSLQFSEKNGGLYHDSGIVSGLFWSFHQELGKSESVQIAWQTLLRLTPKSDFESFHQELLEILSHFPVETQAKAQAILQKRGWSP